MSIPSYLSDLKESEKSKSIRFGVPAGYRHRSRTRYFDAIPFADDWQGEVYLRAAELMRDGQFSSVFDVGCGSAYKLIKYLGEFDTTGFDVPETVAVLQRLQPDRRWMSVSFDDNSVGRADVVICSDVIEHVEDPDALLGFLKRVTGRYLVLSTPDRDLLYGRLSPRHGGPPANPTHVREWSFHEMRKYIGSHFDVVEHCISNREQGTQMLVCRSEGPGTNNDGVRAVVHERR